MLLTAQEWHTGGNTEPPLLRQEWTTERLLRRESVERLRGKLQNVGTLRRPSAYLGAYPNTTPDGSQAFTRWHKNLELGRMQVEWLIN